MATEEHQRLSNIIKSCHDNLRENSQRYGMEEAWKQHSLNKECLRNYAQAMLRLSDIWEENAMETNKLVKSRIKWIIDYCTAYFYTESVYLKKRQREQRLYEAWKDSMAPKQEWRFIDFVGEKLNVLDVGSCFNPFKQNKCFNVTAIDLCPATEDVFKGDFLKIQVKSMTMADISSMHGGVKNEILYLPQEYYDCVIFSLLLEYIPCSDRRLDCCSKAYKLLKPEGILIIVTPDSQHVGKNAAIMKNWRYVLGCLGFMRICFEKLPHITCMVFRKASNINVAQRWSTLHKESYMKFTLAIPQDNKTLPND